MLSGRHRGIDRQEADDLGQARALRQRDHPEEIRHRTRPHTHDRR